MKRNTKLSITYLLLIGLGAINLFTGHSDAAASYIAASLVVAAMFDD